MKNDYNWESLQTGEVVHSFKDVIKTIIINYKTWHFIDWKWKHI